MSFDTKTELPRPPGFDTSPEHDQNSGPANEEANGSPHRQKGAVPHGNSPASTTLLLGGSDGVSTAAHLDGGMRPYLKLLLKHKLLILAAIILSVGITVTRMLIAKPRYVATATILPSGGGGNAGVLGLIASFAGAPPMGGMNEEVSSHLFPSILESRAVGLEVLRSTYRFTLDGQEVQRTLEEHLRAKNVDKALRTLSFLSSFDVHRDSGVLTVSARTLYPELSAQIVNRFVDALERVILVKQKSAASLNGSFIRERLERSSQELRDAERNLSTFRQQNVRISSPGLELELQRLQREVTLKSQLYVTLSSQAEVAQIEEAKDLPVVHVLDRAVVPKEPVPVPKRSSLAMGGIVGVLIAFMAIVAVEMGRYLHREVVACVRR